MMSMNAAEAAGHIRRAAIAAHWDVEALWLASSAIGGSTSLREVTGIISGVIAPTLVEYNNLAVALNDNLIGTEGGIGLPVWG
jgi:hypothetical protein